MLSSSFICFGMLPYASKGFNYFRMLSCDFEWFQILSNSFICFRMPFICFQILSNTFECLRTSAVKLHLAFTRTVQFSETESQWLQCSPERGCTELGVCSEIQTEFRTAHTHEEPCNKQQLKKCSSENVILRFSNSRFAQSKVHHQVHCEAAWPFTRSERVLWNSFRTISNYFELLRTISNRFEPFESIKIAIRSL